MESLQGMATLFCKEWSQLVHRLIKLKWRPSHETILSGQVKTKINGLIPACFDRETGDIKLLLSCLRIFNGIFRI